MYSVVPHVNKTLSWELFKVVRVIKMQPPSLIRYVTDATKCRYKQLPREQTDRSAGFSRKGELWDAQGQSKI